MISAVRTWGPALAWAVVIFLVSSRPTLPVGLELGLDKVAHFVTYGVLGCALARGQHLSGWPWVSALVLGLAYGALDELHQSFVPGRFADAADWAADALGTAAGVSIFHWWHRRRTGQARRRSGTATTSAPT